MGSGTTYTLSWTLPSDREGSFTIDITGNVTVSGTETSVTASPLTIVYDTTANVTATFGTVVYQENGVIEVPITFAEKVIAPATSIFTLEKADPEGDDINGMTYRLIGKDTAFTLIVAVPENRKGSFSIDITGDVMKVSTGVWDNVVITPKTVDYDTRVPMIQNYDIPSTYTIGQRFDVVMEFNVPVTFNDPTDIHEDATYLDFFLFEGADLGTPNLFRSVRDTFPTLPLPSDLQADTNWTQADLQSVAANIFVLRWDTVKSGAQGSFTVTLRPGSVRGPVS